MERRRRDIASFPVSLSLFSFSSVIFLYFSSCLSLDSTRLGSGRRNSLPIVVDCSRELYKGVLENRNTERTNKTLTASFQDRSNQKRQCELFFFRFYLEPAPPLLPCLPSGEIFSSVRPVLMTLSLLKEKKKSVVPMLFLVGSIFFTITQKSAVIFKFTP